MRDTFAKLQVSSIVYFRAHVCKADRNCQKWTKKQEIG